MTSKPRPNHRPRIPKQRKVLVWVPEDGSGLAYTAQEWSVKARTLRKLKEAGHVVEA